ncbi:unnamed protein product [[Candida] boidinii]|uniref:Unnamed protein product n=1 Tax=Candida boidinii TaxID=5477 RepID=A0A9W6TB57_CANBO|nr:unnamed protein product [[Candida] boidinii]GMG14377.1 unnamed protein product [[Candida] boidinii]
MKQEKNKKINNLKIKKLSKKNYLTELSNSIKPSYKNGKIFNNNSKFQLKLTKKNLSVYKKSIKNESYKSKLFNDLVNSNNSNSDNKNFDKDNIRDKIKVNIPSIKNDQILKLTLNDLKINNFKSDLNSYDNKLLNIILKNEKSSNENDQNGLIHESINELTGFKFINIKDEIKNLNFHNFKNKINRNVNVIKNYKIDNNDTSDNSGVIDSLLNSDGIVLKLDDLTSIKLFD